MRIRRISLHIAALGCFAVAALNKEATFVFPLLAAGWTVLKRQSLSRIVPVFRARGDSVPLPLEPVRRNRRIFDRTTGRPAALSLGLGSTLKAVAVRLWTSLYFPLNWSSDPSLPLALLALGYMVAMLWLGFRTRPPRTIWFAGAAILISVIPVLSLLAGSPTLAGSRVLYLPSVWFAILLALALDGVSVRARYTIGVIAILFSSPRFSTTSGFGRPLRYE